LTNERDQQKDTDRETNQTNPSAAIGRIDSFPPEGRGSTDSVIVDQHKKAGAFEALSCTE